jgi:CysZ protein
MDYMAYPLEIAGLTFKDQLRSMRPYRFEVVAFGGLALAGLAVPLLNLFVPPAAVIGATLYIHNKKQHDPALQGRSARLPIQSD